MVQFQEACGAQVTTLAENFRSHEEVVQAAAKLISWNNPHRMPKQQLATRGAGGKIQAISAGELEDQCTWVARDLESAPCEDCAVLSRRNRTLDAVEQALAMAGIPYYRAGTSLWEREDLVAFLALLDYLITRSPDSLLCILGFLRFTQPAVDRLVAAVRPSGNGLEAAAALLDGDERHRASGLAASVAKWRTWLGRGEDSLLLGNSAAAFTAWFREGNQETPGTDDSPSTARVRRGAEIAAEAIGRLSGKLSARLRTLTEARRQTPAAGVVRLMTVHGSKGLEFDRVYVVECDQREEDTGLGTAAAERRVMFVAWTRARNELRLTYSGRHPLFLKEGGITAATDYFGTQREEESSSP